MPLGDGAGGHRDAGLVGADEGGHLLLGDQAQRLVLARGRRALVVGEDDLDLGAAEARQALAVGERHILQVGIAVVDEIDGQLDGRLRVAAGARRVAAQGIDGPDLDGLLRRRMLRDTERQQRRDTTASAPARLNIPFPPKSRFIDRGLWAACRCLHPSGAIYGTQQPGRSTSPAGASRHLPFARAPAIGGLILWSSGC